MLFRSDFRLTDNGVPQTVDVDVVEAMPIDVSLVLDASESVRGALLDRLKAAVTDTARALTPRDRLRLIAVQHQVRRVIDWQPGGKAPDLSGLAGQGSTALYDGLAVGLLREPIPDRRHLVIVFSDGFDTSSILPRDAIVTLTGATDTVLHAVVAVEDLQAFRGSTRTSDGRGFQRGITGADEQFLPGVRALAELTARTGGRAFPVDAKEPLGAAFTNTLRAFRASYVLRFTPSGVAPDGWHTLTVTVARPGKYEVRARAGYAR